MIDLHVHTSFSDSKHTPAHMLHLAKLAGYRAIAFTDHADASNMRHILENMLPMARTYSLHEGIDLFVGVELTHVPPALIPDCIREARELGAQIVGVHGQTLSDVVEEGTNLAAIEGGADILCHPGLITEQEAVLAAEKGVLLELSTRPSNALCNGYLVNIARRTQAKLVINNDAHESKDFIPRDKRRAIAIGAGMTPDEYRAAEENSREFIARLLRPS
ncbi:histidinol phosphate phosphatase domain-containing protein [Desulfovibrio mangrovi]|uniref:histidinol phosphate phosphatase domain-containing protein n=1 Tax=Desulfovibrio mangrovi TaxID=2976983 RepID=UPI00224725DA|nr:histidinol phosphate phosphatase domain-containing protein [Desulfovibrio mangrovi]UZP68693.1 histidinol phosphate phosphatase domain-containing protein [Desulfovibrio mangrovi]